MSDPPHRWVAINAAARSLLRVSASAMIERHVDDLARDETGSQLTSVPPVLAERPHLSGACEITIGDGSRSRVRYELRRSMIPHYHVWALAPDHDC